MTRDTRCRIALLSTAVDLILLAIGVMLSNSVLIVVTFFTAFVLLWYARRCIIMR